jgi:hypothetical protein
MSTDSNEKHKQAPIIVEGDTLFSVDEKLQSLIQFFFDNEYETFNSCEDNVGGTCWIEFELSDWINISEIAFRREPQDLYRFIEDECNVNLLSFDDGHPDDDDEYWIEGESLVWSASVRFPKDSLATFEELIRATLVDPQSKH